MKKAFQMLAISAVVLVGLVASASAQSTSASTRMKVGFDFNVGNTQLPAGEYRIKIVNNDHARKLILVESLEGKPQAIVAGLPSQGSDELAGGEVQFTRYGDKYFLNSIRMGNEQIVHQLLKSRSEREAERESAKTATIRSSQKGISVAAN